MVLLFDDDFEVNNDSSNIDDDETSPIVKPKIKKRIGNRNS